VVNSGDAVKKAGRDAAKVSSDAAKKAGRDAAKVSGDAAKVSGDAAKVSGKVVAKDKARFSGNNVTGAAESDT
jgi:hypothetical protein